MCIFIVIVGGKVSILKEQLSKFHTSDGCTDVLSLHLLLLCMFMTMMQLYFR